MLGPHDERQPGLEGPVGERGRAEPGNDNVVPASRQWTIKGISPDAVEVSREAARRSGMKLNSWVSSALQRAATEADDKPEGAADEALVRKVGELEGYLKEELEQLRAKSEQIESTINSISAILLKLAVKNDVV